jgi:hypothetical protein
LEGCGRIGRGRRGKFFGWGYDDGTDRIGG